MIRFIHTADVHFGMENYGKIDPATGIHTRLLDFERAFNACIDKAIALDVDFFLFAGDAYKTANPSPTQQQLLLRCLLRLFKANIPVVMVIGNHDNPLSFGKAHALDIFNEVPLAGFHVIAKPTSFTLQTKNGPVNIVGIPWPTRNTLALSEKHAADTFSLITDYISKTVSSIIMHYAQELDPTIPAVLTGHLTVSSGIFSGSEKRAIYGTDPIFLPSQLALAPFDYVGLGHLHRYQNLNKNGYPAIVYSGSIERIDFGERNDEKGFCLVTVHEKNNTTHEFIKVPVRPFFHIEVDLKSDTGISQTEQIMQALAKYDLEGAIVKIIYRIPQGKQDTVDLQVIQRGCRAAMYCVGIIPVRSLEAKERRTVAHVDMDLPTLLGLYFDGKEEYKNNKDTLIQKALALQAEIAEQKEL